MSYIADLWLVDINQGASSWLEEKNGRPRRVWMYSVILRGGDE